MTAKDKAKDRQREERLATALRENLRRRKAQARKILPGTGGADFKAPAVEGRRNVGGGRGTAEGGGGAENNATDPSVSADALPPPRSGED